MSKRLHAPDTTSAKRRRLSEHVPESAHNIPASSGKIVMSAQEVREWQAERRYKNFVNYLRTNYKWFANDFQTKLPNEIKNMVQFYVLPRFPRQKTIRKDIEVSADAQKAMFWVLHELPSTREPIEIDLSLPYRHPPALQVSRATRHAAAEAYYADKIFTAPDARTALGFLDSLHPEHRGLIRHFRFAPKWAVMHYSIETLSDQADYFVRLWYALWFYDVRLEPGVLTMFIPREYLISRAADNVEGIWTSRHGVIDFAWEHPSMLNARWSILERQQDQLGGDMLLNRWMRRSPIGDWLHEEFGEEHVGASAGWGEFGTDWEERFMDVEGEDVGTGIAWAERDGVRELVGDIGKEITD